VTEADQFDSYNAKRDELPLIIRHTFAEDTVNKIYARKGITFNPTLFDFYYKNIKIHDFQQFAIFSSFHRYFGGTENLYGINIELYVRLMLAIVDILDRSGISELSKYVTGVKNKHYVSKKESRLSRNILLVDPIYNNIISTKYKSIKNIIAKKNNFIENKINFLVNNEFMYNTPIVELNGKIIPRNDEEIFSSILKFFSTMIY
jgi:hypothetical protein